MFSFEIHALSENAVFNARVEAASPETLVCRLTSKIKTIPQLEEGRMRMRGTKALLAFQGDAVESDASQSEEEQPALNMITCEVMDISPSGFGLQSAKEAPKGGRATVTFETPFGHIPCEAEVRNCRMFGDKFRIGMKILAMDRLSRGSYNRLLHALED